MSAAEKLKALDTLTLKNEHGVPIRSLTVAEQLADALPQIVAVVEAAEKARAADWQPHGKSYWEIEQLLNEIRDSADATLAALDEALT